MTGAAGGGKSRAAAEKLHAYCLKYPGAMALMLRKTRASMINSTVLFFERKIVGGDRGVVHMPSKSRFEYSNGSILAYGGMADEEQREQIRSIGQDGGLDIVWMEEATRFTEEDFNEILARMRGKAAPWQQILLTTNPDASTHWIKRRLIDGLNASLHKSSAEDNPYNPDQYRENLKQLTGVQKLRLVDGLWVQAEGIVYDNWDEGNISVAAEYHSSREVLWAVDDGYVYGKGPGTESYHPRVILFAHRTDIGGYDVFDEYYITQEPSELSLDKALARPYTAPDVSYIDSSAAELKGRFSAKGLLAYGATHSVYEGIKNLRRMVCDGNGVRLIRVNPRCVNLIQEMQSYRYDEDSRASSGGEPKPLKVDDHGPDALRYLTWSSRYDSPD